MFLNFTKSFLCMGGLQCNVMQAPESAMLGILMHDEDESDGAYVDKDESELMLMMLTMTLMIMMV